MLPRPQQWQLGVGVSHLLHICFLCLSRRLLRDYTLHPDVTAPRKAPDYG